MLQSIGHTVGIIEEVQGIAAIGLPHQFAAGIEILVRDIANGLAVTKTGQIIGVVNGGTAGYCPGQASAVVPGEGPAGAVIVAGGVAGCVVGDRFTVVCGQQVLPVGVAIGIGVAVCCENVAHRVVGVSIGRVTILLYCENNRWKERKLPLSVSSRKKQKCSPDLGNSRNVYKNGISMLCTSKHRLWTPKIGSVGIIPNPSLITA